MRLPFGKKTRRKKSAKQLAYQNLEDRRVLATVVAFDVVTGALDIDMNASNDSATVAIASNGNLMVNGNQDMSSAAGTQAVAATALRSINVDGDSARVNQSVNLNSDFSNVAIQNVTIQDVSQVTVNGNYDLGGLLNVSLVGSGGSISDGVSGQLRVGGTTTIAANNNMLALDNANNDFVGTVDLTNAGTGQDMLIADANAIRFSNVVSTGDLNVTAGGNITDTTGATISVEDIARLNAANVILGDQASDSTNFGAVNSTTTGDTIISEDSAITLLNINADNLTVQTDFGIFDGRSSGINVDNLATFDGGTRIRIGDNGTDTFNAGSINFNSSGHVHFWEDSGTVVVGSNTAPSLSMFSEANIADGATATLNVTNNAQFEGANIILGDTATDQFNAGSLHFLTWGDLDIDEDSSMHIIESKNEANRMFLTADGAITDAEFSYITVNLLSTFDATSVNLGDTANDRFNSGSIRYNTTGQFAISEDSSTNIVGMNTASNSSVTSAGAITDNFVAADGVTGTQIDVTTAASFEGTSISLGNESGGEVKTMNFGSLQLNSPGAAEVFEDSATHMTMDSSVDTLTLNSAGALTDATTATVAVAGDAQMTATSMKLGDEATDAFNAQTINVNSPGMVEVTEDSTLILKGTSVADSMMLQSLSGDVLDTMTASTTVSGLLSATGRLVNLGSEATDNLQMGMFNFSSTGNTFVTADSGFEITGTNNSNDRLILRSTGNITDAATSEIRVNTAADIRAVDVIIGELATDCFDIITGPTNLFVVASGTEDVQLGGC